ncbi:hypothetical protein RSOL_452840, partial [Rhizoctonia solani AG-3 Rhs1AP]
MEVFLTRGRASTGHAAEAAPIGPTKRDVSTSSRTSGAQGPTAPTQLKPAHVSTTKPVGQEPAVEANKGGTGVMGSVGMGMGGGNAGSRSTNDDEAYEEANTGVTLDGEPEIDDEPTQVPRLARAPGPDRYSLPSNWGFSTEGEPMSPTAMAMKLREQNRKRRKASSWVIGQGEGPSVSLGQAAQKARETGNDIDKQGKSGRNRETPRMNEPGHTSEAESGGNYSETVAENHQHTVPSEQAIRDYEALIDIMYNEERMKAVEEIEGYYQEMKRRGRAQKKAQEEKAKVPKARPSLGVSFKDLEGEKTPKKTTHTVTATPAKPNATRGMPTGGYLHQKLNDKDRNAKENKGPGGSGNPGEPDDEDGSDDDRQGGGGGGGGGGDDSNDESDSESSDSESSSDEDPTKMTPEELKRLQKKLKKKLKDKKHKERLRKLQLSGFKTKLPATYTGTQDYDIFEQFVYEVETWVEDTGFKEKDAIRHVKGFLKDKAATFYMDHVAPEITTYTMKKLFQELFEYCFPPDVKARLRRRFMSLNQSDRGFKDFTPHVGRRSTLHTD